MRLRTIWVSLVLLAAAHCALAADARAGRGHYLSICAGCHGIDGVPSLEYVPSFARGDRLDQSEAVLVKSVRDGVYRMPPWGAYLTEREIADAIAYARTLAKRKASSQ